MSTSNNIAFLTRSHKVIAAKKKQRRDQVKEVLFDDDARREFLTGFHKRKLAKAEAARSKAKEREKQERLESRREQRQILREQAVTNAAQVEKAYGDLLGVNSDNEDSDSDSEWKGIKSKDPNTEHADEYEDEEHLATVTVVEDFDPDTIIHGPAKPSPSADAASDPVAGPSGSAAASSGRHAPSSSSRSKPSSSSTHTHPLTKSTLPTARNSLHGPSNANKSNAKPRAKKIRYETKDARRRERTKQHTRRTEKAELAGGKASRKKRTPGGKGKKRT